MRRHSPPVLAHAAALAQQQLARLAILLSRVAGQGLVEYGLILVLIMVVCVGILSMVGQTVSDVWYTKLIGKF
jgi:hypothetical protein